MLVHRQRGLELMFLKQARRESDEVLNVEADAARLWEGSEMAAVRS
jgi:hypothetical protein